LNLVEHYAQDRALRTVRSLVAIANHLDRISGRKNLIWVSGSFPVGWITRDSVPLPGLSPEPDLRPGVPFGMRGGHGRRRRYCGADTV